MNLKYFILVIVSGALFTSCASVEKKTQNIPFTDQRSEKKLIQPVQSAKPELKVNDKKFKDIAGILYQYIIEDQFEKIAEEQFSKLAKKHLKDVAEVHLEEIAEKQVMIDKVNKYLTGKLSSYDNFTPDTIIYFASLIYEKEIAKQKYNIVKFDEGIESVDENDSNNEQKITAFPKNDFSETIAFLDEVIKKRGFDEYIDRYVYFRGYCYEEQGDIEKAVDDYQTIIKKYPYSRYLPEVLFRLGEYYFNTGQPGLAIETYNEVLNFPDTHFYDKALYKLGWSYYQTFNFKEAVKYFLKIADIAYRVNDRQDNSENSLSINENQKSVQMSKESLVDEALTYVAICFSNYGNAEKAINQFGKKLKPYSDKLFIKMGETFFAQAKYKDFAQIYNTFFSLYNRLPVALEIQNRIVAIHNMTSLDEAEAFALRESFISEYSPGGMRYEQNKEIDDNILLKALDEIINDTARYYHIKAQTRDEKQLYKKSISLYRKYLDIFSKTKRSPEINFFLAEALFDIGRYEEAALIYKKTAWEFDDAKYRELAAYNEIFAYEKMLKANIQPNDTDSYWAGNMILAIEKYLNTFAQSEKSKTLIIKEGELYFNLQDYDNAIVYFNKARMISKDKNEQIMLVDYIADSYFNKKDFIIAEEMFNDLYKLGLNLNNQNAIKKAQKYIPICVFNNANNLKRNSEFFASANEYIRAASFFIDREKAEKSFAESLRLFILLKNWSAYDDLFYKFEKEFPASDFLITSSISAAKTSETSHNYTTAAKYFDIASTLSAKPVERTKLQLLAAHYYEIENDINKAIELFSKSYRDAATISRSLEYRFKVAELLEKKKDFDRALYGFQEVVNIHKDQLENNKRGNDYYFGKAMLKLLEKPFKEFLNLKLTQPFEDSLTQKTELMQKLVNKYMKVSKLNTFDLTTISFYQMGILLENFRNSILSTPLPRELNEEEKEEYVFMLEEKAFPYEERALKLYEQNIRFGSAESVTNEHINKSYARLAYLAPALYKRNEDVFETRILFTGFKYIDITEEYMPESKHYGTEKNN